MRRFVFALLMACSLLSMATAQELYRPENYGVQGRVQQETLTAAQCVEAGEYTIYIMDVAMPGSRAMQVYSDYKLSYQNGVLVGKMPLFTRDKSAKEYRDFVFDNEPVEDYKVKEKKGNYTITMQCQKGRIAYALTIVCDAKGRTTIDLTNLKTKSTIKYNGQLKQIKKKNK